MDRYRENQAGSYRCRQRSKNVACVSSMSPVGATCIPTSTTAIPIPDHSYNYPSQPKVTSDTGNTRKGSSDVLFSISTRVFTLTLHPLQSKVSDILDLGSNRCLRSYVLFQVHASGKLVT
jgi:hypothetical protein